MDGCRDGWMGSVMWWMVGCGVVWCSGGVA